jgi:membrane protease YdiL (CAAX protease family)
LNPQLSKRILGGFADAPPAPVASPRHLRRLLLIVAGISIAMLLQARSGGAVAPVTTSKIPLYAGLILVELILSWFVIIGIRARGYKMAHVVGAPRRGIAEVVLDLVLAAGAVVFLRWLGPVLFRLLGTWTSNTGFLLPVTAVESVVWIAVSATAGICEEFVFRGYLQRQLWSLTKSLPAALFLQAIIFGAGHIYQGWKPALVTMIYGLIFGFLFAWRRTIVPGAIAHVMVDVLAGLRL